MLKYGRVRTLSNNTGKNISNWNYCSKTKNSCEKMSVCKKHESEGDGGKGENVVIKCLRE